MQAIKNYKKYGSIRKPKMPKVTTKDAVYENLKIEIPKTWLKQYEKKNEKSPMKNAIKLAKVIGLLL